MNPSTKAPSGANNTLARAIDYLGAVEVAPERYAIKHEGRWFVVSQTTLLDYERFDTDGSLPPGDKTATWLDDSDYAEMPPWWSPEQRFAWRIATCSQKASNELDFTLRFTDEKAAKFAAKTARLDFGLTKYQLAVERITASLETGEEVAV